MPRGSARGNTALDTPFGRAGAALGLLTTASLASGAFGAPSAALLEGETCPYGELEWEDFEGTPPDDADKDACTDGAVDPGYGSVIPSQGQGGGWEATLGGIYSNAEFNKRTSWVDPRAQGPGLLEHEQYHMDLQEYWARETEKALQGVTGTGGTPEEAISDAQSDAQEAMNEAAADCKAMQEAYDEETEHGTNEEEQEEWCEKIGDLLDPDAPLHDICIGRGGGGYVEQDRERDGSPTSYVFFSSTVINGFACEGVPFNDPWLLGGSIELPVFEFTGYHMDSSRALLIPPDGALDDVYVLDSTGGLALLGRIRLLIGDESGTTYRGWIESAEPTSQGLAQSVLMGLIEDVRDTGEAVISIEIQLSDSFEDVTANWTQPGFASADVTFGSVLDGFEPWTDLGGHLPGTHPYPRLLGLGTFEPGTEYTLVESSMPANTSAWIVMGFAQGNAPLYGGTLVPTPDVIVPLTTNEDGYVLYQRTLPAGLPSGFQVYVQGLARDTAAVQDVAFTNALLATTP